MVSILCNSLVYAYALGHAVNIGFAAMLLIGIVFIVAGNYLPKSRQNYTVGIKIPWTLNDTENWNATHRFGGRVFIAAGVIVLCLSWAQPQWLIVPVMIAAVIAPMLYSYLYYRRHSK